MRHVHTQPKETSFCTERAKISTHHQKVSFLQINFRASATSTTKPSSSICFQVKSDRVTAGPAGQECVDRCLLGEIHFLHTSNFTKSFQYSFCGINEGKITPAMIEFIIRYSTPMVHSSVTLPQKARQEGVRCSVIVLLRNAQSHGGGGEFESVDMSYKCLQIEEGMTAFLTVALGFSARFLCRNFNFDDCSFHSVGSSPHKCNSARGSRNTEKLADSERNISATISFLFHIHFHPHDPFEVNQTSNFHAELLLRQPRVSPVWILSKQEKMSPLAQISPEPLCSIKRRVNW